MQSEQTRLKLAQRYQYERQRRAEEDRRLSNAQVWAQEEAAKQRSRELIYRAQYLQWLSDTAARDARYYTSRDAR